MLSLILCLQIFFVVIDVVVGLCFVCFLKKYTSKFHHLIFIYTKELCHHRKTDLQNQRKDVHPAPTLSDEQLRIQYFLMRIENWPRGYKTFFMLNSAEHEVQLS